MTHGTAALGDIAEFINGAAFRPEDWGSAGLRIIRIQNLTDPAKPFNRTRRTVPSRLIVRAGDLLVSWSATLGVFEWKGPDDALLNQHIFRVLPDRAKVEKAYLRHVLEKAIVDMQMHLHGATMQHVNRGEFLGTQIYLPPLPEQRRIAEVLDRAEALRARRRQALAHLDALAESIFLEMFGGFAYSQTKALADFCELITDGTHYTPTYADKGIVFLSAKNVTSGEVDWEQVK